MGIKFKFNCGGRIKSELIKKCIKLFYKNNIDKYLEINDLQEFLQYFLNFKITVSDFKINDNNKKIKFYISYEIAKNKFDNFNVIVNQ